MVKWARVCLGFLVWSCSECDLTGGLEEQAGPGATDCGRVALGSDPRAVDDCVVAAFTSGQAFFARYERQGKDSKVAFGIAGTNLKRITFLLWDSDPSGGGDSGAVITGSRCEEPRVDASSGRDPMTMPPLACASTTDLGRTCE
jgi:hypothetical protein